MKHLFRIICILSPAFCEAQSPAIMWQASLGGTANETASCIQQTTDGGYIVGGKTESSDFDISFNHGGNDFWITKLNSAGVLQWEKSYGGSSEDYLNSIKQTSDGGYILAGLTLSTDGDVTGNHGSMDGWIIKITSTGNIAWQKTYGGTSQEAIQDIEETSEGGYIFTGGTTSNDGDVSGHIGWSDIWLVKINSTGSIQWQNCFGGSNDDLVTGIEKTNDGGYVIGGFTESTDGDVSTNHGASDYWIIKLNSSGFIQWEKTFGGSAIDQLFGIIQTSDGGYALSGVARSTDGDVTDNHGSVSADVWVIKLNASGSIQWKKCFGSIQDEYSLTNIKQTMDGGYILAAESWGNGGDVTGNHGTEDWWFIKISSTGSLISEISLGGASQESPFSVLQSSDGKYVIAGDTRSDYDDVALNLGGDDFWIVKLNPTLLSIDENINESTLAVFPNPGSGEFNFSGLSTNDKIRITDISGRLIMESTVTSNMFKLNLENFENGIYTYAVSGEHVFSGKLIKE